MLKKFHLILILLLSLTLISTASCKQGASSDYPVLESGYNAFSDGGSKTYWIDNDQVIFYGYEPKQDKKQIKKGIHVWDTRTGEVRFHAKLGKSVSNFCYGDNVISYFVEQKQEGDKIMYYYMRGPLGQEKKIKRYSKKPENSQDSPYTCQKEVPPPELKDHSWRPLKPEHGCLDYGLKRESLGSRKV